MGQYDALILANKAQINDLANQIGNTFSEVQAVSNVFTLDLSENINFQITLDDGVDKSFVFSNVPSGMGKIINVTARIICTKESALNVPSTVVWQNGIAPAYISKNKYLLMFTSYDNGETWDGSWVGAWAIPPEIIVSDDFNRTDNTTSLDNAVTGQTWQYSAGSTWGISGNKAVQTGVSSGTAFAYIDSGVSNCVIKAKLATDRIQGFLNFRFTNSNNYFCVGRSTDVAHWIIVKIENGSPFILQNVVAQPHQAGDTLEVRLSGSSIKLYVNDILTASTTDTFNQTATIHGLNTIDSIQEAFDDFSVEV